MRLFTPASKPLSPGEKIGQVLLLGVLSFLLVAIFWPVGYARGAAKKTACLSNIKQLALAEQLYAADFDDRFTSANRWIDETKPYTKADAMAVRYIYTCPSVPKDKPFGYAMADDMSKALTTKIKHPEDQVLLFETPNLVPNAHFSAAAPGVPWRHNGFRNFGFADGHAKARSMVQN